MQSREYIEEIDFQKYWLVLKRHWLASSSVFGTVLLLAIVALSLLPPAYRASGRLLFRSDRASSLTGLLGDSNQLGQLEALTQRSDPLSTQAEVVLSHPVIEEAIRGIEFRDEQGQPLNPEAVAEGLRVRPLTGTDVLEISYESDDPGLAAAIVNQVMESYIRTNIMANRAEAAAAREFIIGQLPRTEDAVRRAEEDLRRFKEDNQVVTLQQEADTAIQSIANLDDLIAQAQAQLVDIGAQSSVLRRQLGMDLRQAVDASSLSQATGVQEVLTQLQTVQNTLATERTRYQSVHPQIANLERREAALSQLLQQRVAETLGVNTAASTRTLQFGELRQQLTANLVQLEAERLGLTQRIAQLTTTRAGYQQRASAYPSLEKTQRELERRLTAAQTTYETLLTRFQEIQVAENQNVGNARVIESALVPARAMGPSKLLFLAGGGVAGLLLGVATAFLLDLNDKSIKTVRDVKALFKYTLLGVIPTLNPPGRPLPPIEIGAGATGIVVRDNPRSPLSAAYQMLQANLKFLGSDAEVRSVVVSSSVAKEGRSEVAANLAAAMAQAGRRVLLVDADMRHPAQHHIWELTNAVGLSNVIVGQVDAGAATQLVMDSLHVMTAGVMPPNPVALLNSERMLALVKSFLRDYDFVVFDTPPLSGTADAAVLSKLADGILLVVRPGVVNAVTGTAAKEFLDQGHQVLGMVINGVNVKHEPDSYFYYMQEQPENKLVTPGLSSVGQTWFNSKSGSNHSRTGRS